MSLLTGTFEPLCPCGFHPALPGGGPIATHASSLRQWVVVPLSPAAAQSIGRGSAGGVGLCPHSLRTFPCFPQALLLGLHGYCLRPLAPKEPPNLESFL